MSNETKTAYVFPGQGSQAVGMGLDLYREYPTAKKIFDEADARLGFALSRLCFEGPAEELKETRNVQPAVLTTSLAMLAVARETCPKLPAADFVSGHSLGEYSALVEAGVLELSGALLLVRERGQLMEAAARNAEGGMAAIIGLDKTIVKELCEAAGVYLSNLNSPGQIVISGALDKLKIAMAQAKERGARRVVPLKVSGAFHSPLMQPAVLDFIKAIANTSFSPARIPVVTNVNAEATTSTDDIKKELVEQLVECVQWQDSVLKMVASGVNTFYEFGPGTVLRGLIRSIAPEAQVVSVNSLEAIAKLADS